LYANAADLSDPDPKSGTPSADVYPLNADIDSFAKGEDSLPQNDCRSTATPCLTFDHAYHAAKPGELVGVTPGSYPKQVLLDDPSKTSP
jgi:hypothetical protein